MKTISNKVWALIIAVILAVCCALAYYLYHRSLPGDTAVVYLDNNLVAMVDLSKVETNYTQKFTGTSGITNTVEFAHGKVRVVESTCPDHICVYQGWIESNGLPIACLPNTLIVQVVDAETMRTGG